MKTIDIYTTPQCGFCQALKAELDQKNISYTSHDVTTSEDALAEMRKLSGSMSVPVTVIDKGVEDQQVLIGYPDAAQALGLVDQLSAEAQSQDTAILTCPQCGHQQEGLVPTTACVPFYICDGCQATIQASGEDCCVFCSYADRPCPLKTHK